MECIHTYKYINELVIRAFFEFNSCQFAKKNRQNALSNYESWNSEKKRDRFSVSKVNFAYAQNWFIEVWLAISFSSFISVVKGKANAIEQQKFENCEKRDRVLALKVEFNLQIFSGIKSLPIDQFFEIVLVFLKKCKS